MHFGTIKSFNSHTGYGFIQYDEQKVKRELFFHFTKIAEQKKFRKLKHGDKVSFVIKINPTYNKEQAFEIQQIK